MHSSHSAHFSGVSWVEYTCAIYPESDASLFSVFLESFSQGPRSQSKEAGVIVKSLSR
jgi:hypothetical protein